MNDLKNRRLFKRSYVKELSEISSPIKRMEIWKKYEGTLEKEIADEAGVNSEFVITRVKKAAWKAIGTFGRVTESNEIPIMYIDRDRKPQLYDDMSPITLRKEPSQVLYVFTKKEYKDKVVEVCKKKLC